jgi:hypothetical protein
MEAQLPLTGPDEFKADLDVRITVVGHGVLQFFAPGQRPVLQAGALMQRHARVLN